MNRTRGFTVIELMVVIAIIAMLMAGILVALSSAREKSRDGARMATLNQIQKALDLYYANNNGFPIEATAVTITGDDSFSVTLEADGVIPEVRPDPAHPTYTYTYQSSDGSDYTLSFCLETSGIATYSQDCGNTLSP